MIRIKSVTSRFTFVFNYYIRHSNFAIKGFGFDVKMLLCNNCYFFFIPKNSYCNNSVLWTVIDVCIIAQSNKKMCVLPKLVSKLSYSMWIRIRKGPKNSLLFCQNGLNWLVLRMGLQKQRPHLPAGVIAFLSKWTKLIDPSGGIVETEAPSPGRCGIGTWDPYLLKGHKT